MDALATAASPILKLRGSWTVVDPATARKAKKRLIRTVKPAQAIAAALTGVVQVERRRRRSHEAQVIVGASLPRCASDWSPPQPARPSSRPIGLHAHLRDYQRQGLTWLADLTGLGLGACLADDMGLGKTITLIALHLHRVEAGVTGPTLVVCPASLLGNWEAEIRRFAPGVDVRRFHGAQRDLADLEIRTVRRAGSCSPPTAPCASTRAARAHVAWDLVVADEAQHVKNPASSTARALRAIPSRGPGRADRHAGRKRPHRALGDPRLGHPRSARQSQRLPQGVGPTDRVRPRADQGRSVRRPDRAVPAASPQVRPRHRARAAAQDRDRPPALAHPRAGRALRGVRARHHGPHRARRRGARRGLVLALLTGLKQICNHPAQFLKQSGAVRLGGRSEKLDLLDELLGTVLPEGGGVLVFTQYVAMARLIESHLAKAGVPHQFLHGGTPVRDRERMVAAFQAVPELEPAPVFLLSLKAGGTGLNLTRADHVVHIDRWWNPAVEEQATDRAYRIGQTRPVQVHRMIMRGTIEEKVAELLARKRALADAVLGRGDAALTELSNDELRDLVMLRPDTGTP